MDDALGETRAKRALGLLVTNHFETVDRALWAFFNLVEESPIEKTDLTREVAQKSRATTDLFVKKFFILCGLCLFEEIQSHYREKTPDDENFDMWIKQLKKGFNELFFGKLKTRAVKKDPFILDMKYPTVEIFCVKMIALYLTM